MDVQVVGFHYLMILLLIFDVLTPLSAISWQPVLVVEETGVPEENHRPWASSCESSGHFLVIYKAGSYQDGDKLV